jgi:Saxitoxin biosynthesis operon protein SxtJ
MGHESFQRDESIPLSSNRSLGFVFAGAFLVIGVLPLVWGSGVRPWSLMIAAGFMLCALAAPSLLGPLNRAWMRFGMLLHRIVSPVVLGIMFFLVITPMGTVMRLLGKDPLRLRYDGNASTYWVDRTPPGPPPQSLNHQF